MNISTKTDGIRMKVPTIAEAERILKEAEKTNPGVWIDHSLLDYAGTNDCSEEETNFIKHYLESEYDDYDRLSQLCDGLSLPSGATFMERRLIDVVLRKGFNEYTIPKWREYFKVKEYFDCKAKCDVHRLIGIEW